MHDTVDELWNRQINNIQPKSLSMNKNGPTTLRTHAGVRVSVNFDYKKHAPSYFTFPSMSTWSFVSLIISSISASSRRSPWRTRKNNIHEICITCLVATIFPKSPTISRKDMSQFGSTDKALCFTVKGLEGFHKVCECPLFLLLDDSLVDGQELVEFVLFLTYRTR